jgi:hypothetical protein
MGKPIPLIGSPYDTRDPIKAARRCVNLYPEKNGQSDSQTNPFPYRYWPIPGLRKVAQAPNAAPIRCEYTASNGDLYVVSGNAVYFVAADLSWNALGTIHEAITPVSMADNGLCIILVDGTSTGYVIDMASRQFGGISDDAFYGADRVDYVDTYFTFNRPGTNQWYISLSEATFAMLTANLGFDPLDVAAKTGGPDQLVTQIVKHREVWLIGSLTSEPWFDAGAADFAFAAIPGAFIDHGCVARYSVARQDVSVFWLSRDREGQGIVVRTDGYEPKRISTHGIEADIQTYSRIDDAIGFCLQQSGHAFYILTFPTADKTWAFDLSADNPAEAWSEWAWLDDNGKLHRHRANCHTFAYGINLVGDWQNGTLYALDPTVFTDSGKPVLRIRTFPHIQNGGNLVTYNRFVADMQVGSDSSDGSLGSPLVSLRYSNDRGATWSDALVTTLGATGAYSTQVDWWQLGCGRDYVFEVSYAAPVSATIGGAYIEAEAHGA